MKKIMAEIRDLSTTHPLTIPIFPPPPSLAVPSHYLLALFLCSCLGTNGGMLPYELRPLTTMITSVYNDVFGYVAHSALAHLRLSNRRPSAKHVVLNSIRRELYYYFRIIPTEFDYNIPS